jgi:hypothetical protein
VVEWPDRDDALVGEAPTHPRVATDKCGWVQNLGSLSARCRGGLVASALLVCVGGCSASPAPAEDVAGRFERAISDADWSTACGLLAPRTRATLEKSAGQSCSAALRDEDLPDAGPSRRAQVFGTMAQVRFEQDTVFLGVFPGGWHVVAAGCAPVAGKPYDCRLAAG